MRSLGLDLGTKTLGLAISDKTNMISMPLSVLRWNGEDYSILISELKKIVELNDISVFVLGLPKNMNNSLGFAAERSLNFKRVLENEFTIPVVLIDERLSTMEATNYLLASDMSRKKRKKVVDGVAASIILDTYLKREGNNGK